MFTGATLVVPEYESSWKMISDQMFTGQRVVIVRHCVTVAFLTPFFCVRNVGETLLVNEWRYTSLHILFLSVKSHVTEHKKKKNVGTC